MASESIILVSRHIVLPN
jgi:dihydroorotase-like cyclic amidohydrolase